MKSTLILISILFSLLTFSQEDSTDWLNTEEINSTIRIVTSKTDNIGNLYVLSSFSDSIIFNKTQFYSKEKGTFLTKYNSDGEIEP